MNGAEARRGGAPVGMIRDLDRVEAASVIYLRLWCDSVAGKAEIETDFTTILGEVEGRHAARSFLQLCELCTREGRRPLMRHATTCKCLGADEACFANLVATAAAGERADAMLIATLMVRPAKAGEMAELARDVGVALRRMRLPPFGNTVAPARPEHTTLH